MTTLADLYGERAYATVLDLRDFLGSARRLAAHGKAAYDTDETLRLASEAILHRIGEAASRLQRECPELVTDHPGLPWRELRGARNIVAHEYGRIDHQIIWVILEVDLPAMARQIDAMLDR